MGSSPTQTTNFFRELLPQLSTRIVDNFLENVADERRAAILTVLREIYFGLMAILKLKNGVATGTVFALKLGVTRIGRGEGNDYRVPDQSVSHAHCEFHLDNDGFLFVKDLGSSNGTYIDGDRVDEARLLPGQTLSLGGLDLMFDNRWWTTASASSAEIPSPVTGKSSDGSTAFFSRKQTQPIENPTHAAHFS